jgi:hypothetical protein
MESRVKISHFTQKHKSLLDYFGWQSFVSNIFGSETISLHNIALFLFDYKIGFNNRQQIVQHRASRLPIINRTSEFLLACVSISRIFGTTKSIFKPYYKNFIAARYFKTGMPLKAIAIFALFNIAQIEATFTVYKTCKISDLPYLMTCIESNYFSHEFPFVYNSITLNEYEIHAERLNPEAAKADAIV